MEEDRRSIKFILMMVQKRSSLEMQEEVVTHSWDGTLINIIRQRFRQFRLGQKRTIYYTLDGRKPVPNEEDKQEGTAYI